jgi:hypothetical protein
VNEFSRIPGGDAMPPPATGQAALSLVRTCFADEIAIDFPSIGPAVERVRDMFVAPDDHVAAIAAQVTVTPRQASSGAIVRLELGLNGLCAGCGGRGESWAEPCHRCAGTGECPRPHHFRLAVPAGVADGTRFRFVVTPPTARATRVEVTVSVA